MQESVLFIVWGGTALIAMTILLRTYAPWDKKWLKNL